MWFGKLYKYKTSVETTKYGTLRMLVGKIPSFGYF